MIYSKISMNFLKLSYKCNYAFYKYEVIPLHIRYNWINITVALPGLHVIGYMYCRNSLNHIIYKWWVTRQGIIYPCRHLTRCNNVDNDACVDANKHNRGNHASLCFMHKFALVMMIILHFVSRRCSQHCFSRNKLNMHNTFLTAKRILSNLSKIKLNRSN